MKNKQVVTSSLKVSETFNKNHRDVLKAIDELKEGVAQNFADLFYESSYTHEQNKQKYRSYLMNRDGFTLLAMGFTGKKAMEFKLKYIKAFNAMEKEITQPRILTDKEQLTASMKLSIEANEKLENHDERITNLEDTMRIDGVQEHKLQKAGRSKVVKVLGGKKSPAYKELSSSLFQVFWNEFKDHFMIPRYNELPKKDFDQAIEFISVWEPKTSTRMEIADINRQMTMERDSL